MILGRVFLKIVLANLLHKCILIGENLLRIRDIFHRWVLIGKVMQAPDGHIDDDRGKRETFLGKQVAMGFFVVGSG